MAARFDPPGWSVKVLPAALLTPHPIFVARAAALRLFIRRPTATATQRRIASLSAQHCVVALLPPTAALTRLHFARSVRLLCSASDCTGPHTPFQPCPTPRRPGLMTQKGRQGKAPCHPFCSQAWTTHHPTNSPFPRRAARLRWTSLQSAHGARYVPPRFAPTLFPCNAAALPRRHLARIAQGYSNILPSPRQARRTVHYTPPTYDPATRRPKSAPGKKRLSRFLPSRACCISYAVHSGRPGVSSATPIVDAPGSAGNVPPLVWMPGSPVHAAARMR